MDDRLAPVVLTPELRAQIEQAAGEGAAGTRPTPKKAPQVRRRLLLTGVAACLAVMFGVGAVAMGFPSFERFIEKMGEDTRSVVQPVNLEAFSADTGVGMEVLAAVNDGDNAVVFLSLSEGPDGRIDERTELYDLDISGTHLGMGTLAYYDEETSAAVFRLEGNGQDIGPGQEVTITVNSMLTGVEYHERIDTGLTLATVMEQNPSPALMGTNGVDGYGLPTGGFGLSYGEDVAVPAAMHTLFEAGEMPMLAAQQEGYIPQNASWIEITAAGVVDGYLHVQYRAATEAGRYAGSEIFLTWPGGQQEAWGGQLTTAQLDFGAATEIGYHRLYEYHEAILELPEGVPAEDISIAVSGSSCEEYVEGNWSVSFVLDDSPPMLETECSIDMNGWVINRVVVSPIGITVYGQGEMGEHSEGLFMEAFYKDGTPIPSDMASTTVNYSQQSGEDSITSHSNFTKPIPVENIGWCELNGVKYFMDSPSEAA